MLKKIIFPSPISLWVEPKEGTTSFYSFSLASSLLFPKPTCSIWRTRQGHKGPPQGGWWRLARRQWKFSAMNMLTSALPFPLSH